MKLYSLSISFVLVAVLRPAGAQEVTLQTLPPGMVIDNNWLRETDTTIESAVADNRIDLLYLALHNNIDVNYCLDRVHKLERTKQAQLLSRLLLDDKFIDPGKDKQNYSIANIFMNRQIAVKNLAADLLGEPAPGIHFSPREERVVLATRLQAIK